MTASAINIFKALTEFKPAKIGINYLVDDDILIIDVSLKILTSNAPRTAFLISQQLTTKVGWTLLCSNDFSTGYSFMQLKLTEQLYEPIKIISRVADIYDLFEHPVLFANEIFILEKNDTVHFNDIALNIF